MFSHDQLLQAMIMSIQHTLKTKRFNKFRFKDCLHLIQSTLFPFDTTYCLQRDLLSTTRSGVMKLLSIKNIVDNLPI